DRQAAAPGRTITTTREVIDARRPVRHRRGLTTGPGGSAAMNLFEIRCPAHALDDEDRALLAGDIVDGMVGDRVADEVAEETLRRARAMTHVGFVELHEWTTGDGPWRPGAAPPLWITMTVPEQWREEMSRHLIGWVRRAVRRLDARHGW